MYDDEIEDEIVNVIDNNGRNAKCNIAELSESLESAEYKNAIIPKGNCMICVYSNDKNILNIGELIMIELNKRGIKHRILVDGGY